jgi:hypothetical protein
LKSYLTPIVSTIPKPIRVSTKPSHGIMEERDSQFNSELNQSFPIAPLFPRPFLIVSAAAFAVVCPFFLLGVLAGHDFAFHLSSWMEVLTQWRQGIIYPRWGALAHYGYGEPRFIFYPPGSWVLGAVLGSFLPWRLVPGTFVWFALTLSGCSMFLLARTWLKPRDAIFAAALYAANPYYFVIVYWRSDFAELLAGALLPLLLLFCLQAHEKSSKPLIFLSLIIAAAWLTNAPVGVIVNYSLGVLILVIAVSRRSLHSLAVGFMASLLGGALAAFYLLPAAYEQAWVNIGQVLGKGLRPQDNFLFTNIGDVGHDAFNRILSLLAVAQIATTLVAFVSARLWQSRNRQPISWALAAWAAAAALLVISTSAPLWTHLPKLQFLQFPWRWLLCLNVAFALLVTVAWKSKTVRVVICVAMLGILVFGAWHIQRPWKSTSNDIARLADLQLSGEGYKGRPEYVPSGAVLNAQESTGLVVLESSGQAWINVQKWAAESKMITANVSQPEKLVFRLFNYPAWKVEVNGRLVKSESGASGQVVVPIEAGQSVVHLSFSPTWDRTLGQMVSAATFLTISFFLCFKKRAAGR